MLVLLLIVGALVWAGPVRAQGDTVVERIDRFGEVTVTPEHMAVDAAGAPCDPAFVLAGCRGVTVSAAADAPENNFAEPNERARTSTLGMAAGGLIGGALGIVGGGLAGAAIACGAEDADTFCGFYAVPGAIIGETLLTPIGVHVANRGRGSWWRGIAASFGITAAGLLLAGLASDVAYMPEIIAASVPAAQIGASISIERAASD